MLPLLPVALAVIILAGKATSKYCDGDYFCTPPKECCSLGCCYLYPPPAPNFFNFVSWNHWFLWCVAILGVALLCVVCGCGLWRRRDPPVNQDAASEPDSAGSCCQPPHYSRCSSFHQPPPYSEVTSKPDLYPLVISYSDNGKSGGSYLMVQYFRNYIMRPVGSLSATSTADSLSSSLFCNATNEANSLVPPPYSSAPDSVDQIQPSDTPFDQSLSSCHAHSCVLVSEAPPGRQSLCGGLSTVSSVAGLGGPLHSPPRATSPTTHLLHKINQLPSQQSGGSGSSSRLKLYMPLTRGRHWLSRSAPTTPSSRLTPATPFPSGESSPLLQPDVDQDTTF
uniref:WW domain binding protein VOPP1 n=1 Tax=Graphocephala atropunctata TaxID=36148 RepID=A0A1B6MSP8_9HEMI